MISPGEHGRNRDENTPNWYAKYSALGFQFALTLGVFTGLGYLCDKYLGSLPWGTIVGTFFGFAGGTISLYRQVFPADGDQK